MLTEKIKYLKNNIHDESIVNAVYLSLRKTKKILLVITFLSIIIGIMLLVDPFIKYLKYNNTNTRTGHLDNDKIWYIYDTKQEIDASNYNINYQNYENNHEFTVLLENGKVIDIYDKEDIDFFKKKALNKTLLIYLVIFITNISLYFIIIFTVGRNWFAFTRWYAKKKSNSKIEDFQLPNVKSGLKGAK